jgi:NDP-sugar pyrophosphorylase family protein
MRDGIRDGLKMTARPFDGYWVDIGRPEDYEAADTEFAALKVRLGVA